MLCGMTRERGGSIDQTHLANGQIIGARGPPEHRFFLVLWTGGEFKWLLHKSFTPQTQHLIDNFFFVHFHLDRGGAIGGGPDEARCAQCNMFFSSLEERDQHVHDVHTFPVRRGTLAYHKANKKVQQRFQETLPKVQLRGGEVRNKFMKKWVGMSYTADN